MWRAIIIIISMYKLYPYFTNDGSVGLFSPEADDIYHSTYGALSEAYEKFILPAELEKYFEKNNEIKILDICYGIGYNTKSFLNFLLEKNILKFEKNITKNKTNETIHSNNIYNYKIDTNNQHKNTRQTICIDKLYSNNISTQDKNNPAHEKTKDITLNNDAIHSDKNSEQETTCETKNCKIFIKALDSDKTLLFLSPFFKQGNEKDKRHNKLTFNYEKITKLLNNKFEAKYKLSPIINLVLLKQIIDKTPEILENDDFIKILNFPKYKPFFDEKTTALFKTLKTNQTKYTPTGCLRGFLHNIYYSHVSASYKRTLNSLYLNDFIFEPVVGDARASLQKDKEIYNFIFLDAFTPAKCPALWSLEFFKLLFNHLDNDGMILTYSNSAAIRNAMINAGFYVGKIFNDSINKFTGTIAVKNKSLIKHELSEYDLGLINSKAGIFYRDENLNALNEEILASHKLECENSDKISSSRFIKEYKSSHQS